MNEIRFFFLRQKLFFFSSSKYLPENDIRKCSVNGFQIWLIRPKIFRAIGFFNDSFLFVFNFYPKKIVLVFNIDSTGLKNHQVNVCGLLNGNLYEFKF